MNREKKSLTKNRTERSGLISAIDLRGLHGKIFLAFIYLFLSILAFMCLAPPLWIVLSSLKDIKEFYAIPPTIIPRTFRPEKIVETWNMMDFGRYYINTFIVAGGSITFSVVINGLAGYVISKLKPKGSKVVFAMIFWTLMLPNTVGMVPIYKNIIDFPILHINLMNTYWPLFMMAGANAFLVLVFKSFFDGIPSSLMEAASLDGCNAVSTFFKIVLPLSKPVIFTTVILTLNVAWSDFFWPNMILSDKSVQTIIVKIFEMKANVATDVLMVALSFTMVPPIIMFLFFQKYIMQGFTMSGIKG